MLIWKRSSHLAIVFLAFNLYVSASYATEKKMGKDCSCHKIPNRFAALAKTDLHSGMAQIPAGTFMMGGDNSQAKKDDLPKHKVTMSGFWMDKTQITKCSVSEICCSDKICDHRRKKTKLGRIKKTIAAGYT